MVNNTYHYITSGEPAEYLPWVGPGTPDDQPNNPETVMSIFPQFVGLLKDLFLGQLCGHQWNVLLRVGLR